MKLRRQFMRIFSTAVLTVLSALLCPSCSPDKTPAERAAEAGILLAGNSADPSSLDPALATGLGDFKILCGLFEGLVRADPKTLEPLPAVAKSWTISPDGLVYTFSLDKDAKWSDGSRVLASDFVFAWLRALDPVLGAEYASLLFPVKNAQKFNSGELKNPAEVGVRALSEEVFEVRLERPTPYFLSLLYLGISFPLPQKTLEKFGAEKSRDALWTRPQNMVCNGPFVLAKWSINDRVSIRKNPLYRLKDKIFLNGVDFFPISNVNTEDRAFRAGQLHITESVAPSHIDSARAQNPSPLNVSDWFGVYYYQFNAAKPPFDNPKVRRALSLAIDRRAIVDTFLRAGQKPADTFIPPHCGAYELSDKTFALGQNIAEAKRLLAQAGYPDGKNFPTVKISYNTSEQHKPIAEAVQNMWRQNLGVHAELYNLSWPAYLAARRTGDFEVARSSWIADFAAPESFLQMFASDSGLNHGNWRDAPFDALLAKARSALDSAARLDALARAESRLLEECPVMPIYFYSKVCLKSPALRGWENNPLDIRDYRRVWLATKTERPKSESAESSSYQKPSTSKTVKDAAKTPSPNATGKIGGHAQ